VVLLLLLFGGFEALVQYQGKKSLARVFGGNATGLPPLKFKWIPRAQIPVIDAPQYSSIGRINLMPKTGTRNDEEETREWPRSRRRRGGLLKRGEGD